MSKIRSWVQGTLIFFALLMPIVASATPLGDLPIRHEGRVKPFETFARASLLQLLGKESVKFKDSTQQADSSISATEWMSRVLFKPQAASKYPVFLINDPQVAIQIGLEPSENRRYSYKQLAQQAFKIDTLGSEAAAIEARNRTTDQSEFLRIRENFLFYKELIHSQEIFLPHHDFALSPTLAQECGLAPGPNSMYALLQHIGPIAQRLENLNGKAPQTWDSIDLEVMKITRAIYEWSQSVHAQGPQIFAIQGDWLCSGQLIEKQVVSKSENRSIVRAWAGIVDAYLGRNNEALAKNVQTMIDWNNSASEKLGFKPSAITAEQYYNHIKPFRWALILFLVGSLIFLTSMLSDRQIWIKISLAISSLGLAFLIYGILSRMYITWRPPVTNLYETFLFVGAVIGLLGLILSRFGHLANGTILLSFGGLALTWLSGRFAVDGDTLKVLQAVLDSNFWLSTHVVTISLGYAGVVAAGIAGHVFLIQRILGVQQQHEDSTWKSMMAMLGFGLIMSVVGTVLGGVWADQSWGRFWGWDPKENGALLIVLWCAILYHAKISGMIGKIGMALGNGIGIMVVVLAWFGINLLGVGLHSYGFTSGAEIRFFAYLGIQSLVLLILGIAVRQRRKPALPPQSN